MAAKIMTTSALSHGSELRMAERMAADWAARSAGVIWRRAERKCLRHAALLRLSGIMGRAPVSG
jgi:hypothetical protein